MGDDIGFEDGRVDGCVVGQPAGALDGMEVGEPMEGVLVGCRIGRDEGWEEG